MEFKTESTQPDFAFRKGGSISPVEALNCALACCNSNRIKSNRNIFFIEAGKIRIRNLKSMKE
jgi:hypothetical protein